jgi:hypothetical protein
MHKILASTVALFLPDLCLLKMVSGLQSEKSAVRALCERWVEHCLTRGDTGLTDFPFNVQ